MFFIKIRACNGYVNRNHYDLQESQLKNQIYKEVIKMRVKITLACTETGDRNYISTKNKRNNPDRIELMKFCPRLNKRTLHRETK